MYSYISLSDETEAEKETKNFAEYFYMKKNIKYYRKAALKEEADMIR
jgi:hypothetical protein